MKIDILMKDVYIKSINVSEELPLKELREKLGFEFKYFFLDSDKRPIANASDEQRIITQEILSDNKRIKLYQVPLVIPTTFKDKEHYVSIFKKLANNEVVADKYKER